jgi:hypothetical protein
MSNPTTLTVRVPEPLFWRVTHGGSFHGWMVVDDNPDGAEYPDHCDRIVACQFASKKEADEYVHQEHRRAIAQSYGVSFKKR